MRLPIHVAPSVPVTMREARLILALAVDIFDCEKQLLTAANSRKKSPMQIPKLLLVLNAFVLAVIPTVVHAVQTQSTIALAPLPAIQRAPMLLAAAGELTPPAGNTDSDAAARLREAMRKALSESAPPPEQKPVKPAPVKAPKPTKPRIVVTRRVPEEPAQPPLAQVEQPAEVREEPAQPPPAQVEQPAEPGTRIVKPSRTRASEPVFSDPSAFLTPSLAPVLPSDGSASAATAIPSAIPASKEGRLAVLLGQYKSDAITAEDYHSKRAAILAEP